VLLVNFAAMMTRREFLIYSSTLSVCVCGVPAFLNAAQSAPHLSFPAEPRERIAVASYPFRDFIVDPEHPAAGRIELKDFAAHVISKFKVNKIEPWTGHFPSTDAKYLEQFRTAVEKANAVIANIAVDGEQSPYAVSREEREQAVAFRKKWVGAAAALGAHSVRTNIPDAKDSKPDLERAAESFSQIVDYAARKNVVVNLENDNPVSENPFFLVELIDKVNSPWLHALPDFGNTLAHFDADHAYRGIDAMFRKAFCICHVKEMEAEHDGKLVHVDLAKTFGMLKQRGFKGYLSMEFDSPGDPYAGTADLISKTLQYLS
jgi:sugar phosphate isomerase/epimerase